MRTTLLILLIFAAGCELADHSDDDTETNNGFETSQVAEIFSQNCAATGCHTGSNPPNGLSIDSHAKLLSGSQRRPLTGADNYGGDVIIPYKSAYSLLYQIINNNISTTLSVTHNILLSNQIAVIKKWVDDGAKDNNSNIPFTTPLSYRVYVCNQKTDVISVVDGTYNVVSRIVDVNETANIDDEPYMVQEYGDYYYVTLSAMGRFLKISKSDNEIAGVISGLSDPGMIQITSSGLYAYVSRSSTAESIYSSIYMIDIVNMTLVKEINLVLTNGLPHGIVLSPDNTKLYVANIAKNAIHVINTTINEAIDLINFGVDYQPINAAISPDGYFLYLSAEGTSQFLIFNTQTRNIIYQLTVNPSPRQIVVSNNGSYIYVASQGASVVEVIQKTGFVWTKIGVINHPAFSMLEGIDLSSDSRYLYVSGSNIDGDFTPAYQVKGEEKPGVLGIIDTQTFAVIKVIELESNPSGLCVEK